MVGVVELEPPPQPLSNNMMAVRIQAAQYERNTGALDNTAITSHLSGSCT
jgi:hypothetical protein